ncbi:MAG: hypothetical protein RI933_1010 [Actinomycetota bacterium]|jgi:hypothetical protein|uniref:Uncharacterized protein n=1 Tax=Candidatus Rhodoluna planktonica TaxID=535712 RepID=A0A1D9DXC9_9MICO|nr:hypothetical protein [Candidatus Rhodoluna planktonica]AOY55455.1 hypothetical protein A4Z71_00035 [Candidatus Rhodoluna planktonica]
MAKKATPKESKRVRSYLVLSAVAAAFVAIIVYGGIREISQTLIWAGLTFVISLVGIATLDLSIKDDKEDPNQPRLK